MKDLTAQVAAVLGRYLSPINADGMLRRALRNAQLNEGVLSADALPRLISALETGIGLFVDESRRAEFRGELQKLRGTWPAAQRFFIRQESDAAQSRLAARVLCEQLGARGLTCQKVATAVSELARNILSYAREGHIDITPEDNPRRVVVHAVDSGPGITNLDEIMAGRYRSKTGLGRGLLGIKSIADRFAIHTDASGTRVELEMAL